MILCYKSSILKDAKGSDMRRNYDEEPSIPEFKGITEGAQDYWNVSHAVKGTRGYTGRYTVGRVFEVLRPLSLQIVSPTLRSLSEELAQLVVVGKSRRQPIEGGGKVIQLPLTSKTQKVEPNSKSEKVA